MALDPDRGAPPENPNVGRLPQTYGRADLRPSPSGPANLADILERVLDKGIVIAGDIEIRLFDIELLTIKLRLLVASVDRAREMGINWWESDPTLTVDTEVEHESSRGQPLPGQNETSELSARVERLERLLEDGKRQSGSRRRGTQKG